MKFISTSFNKKMLLLLHLHFVFCFANAQEIPPPLSLFDTLTAIILQSENGSEVQQSAIDTLRIKIIELQYYDHKHHILSQEEKRRIWKIDADLCNKIGIFEKINPYYRGIVSDEVITLENQLKSFDDSISRIKNRLIEIVENEKRYLADKEKATQVLVSIHRLDVLDYIFENQEKLVFGVLDSNDQMEESYRTALWEVNLQYSTGEKRNWMLFPFLYQGLKRIGFTEMGLINFLLSYPHPLESPWLLLQFMYDNATPQNKPVLQELMNWEQFKNPNK